MNRAQFFKSLFGVAIASFVIKEVAENPEEIFIGGDPNEESGNFVLEHERISWRRMDNNFAESTYENPNMIRYRLYHNDVLINETFHDKRKDIPKLAII